MIPNTGSSSAYIVFGVARQEQGRGNPPQQDMRSSSASEGTAAGGGGTVPRQLQESPGQEPEEEGEVDMEGLNPRDVELVMAQSGVSKAR